MTVMPIRHAALCVEVIGRGQPRTTVVVAAVRDLIADRRAAAPAVVASVEMPFAGALVRPAGGS